VKIKVEVGLGKRKKERRMKGGRENEV